MNISVFYTQVKVNASWTGCYWDFDGETMCSQGRNKNAHFIFIGWLTFNCFEILQNAGIPGNNVECDEFRVRKALIYVE